MLKDLLFGEKIFLRICLSSYGIQLASS